MIKLQQQGYYQNQQLELLGDLLTTIPIRTGWEIFIEPHPNRRFRRIANPDHQFGNCSVSTRAQTGRNGRERLLTLASTLVLHRSVQLLECHGTNRRFITASPLEYTTVLFSLPFLLPPSLHCFLPPSLSFLLRAFLLPLQLSPLLPRSSSLPLHYSPPVSCPNLHITTVSHSLPNSTIALTPMICNLFRMQWMAGGGGMGWPKNMQLPQTIHHQLCLPWCPPFILWLQ